MDTRVSSQASEFECEDCGRHLRWPSKRVEMCGHIWCGPCYSGRRYEQHLEDSGYYAEHEEDTRELEED